MFNAKVTTIFNKVKQLKILSICKDILFTRGHVLVGSIKPKFSPFNCSLVNTTFYLRLSGERDELKFVAESSSFSLYQISLYNIRRETLYRRVSNFSEINSISNHKLKEILALKEVGYKIEVYE